MTCHIDYLPDEILEYILNLIPPYKDLKECKLVCKRWNHAVKHVIEHKDAYFQRSVAHGSLVWDTLPLGKRLPSITKRHSHSACIYENSMYIFGGCTNTGTTFNDLWIFDLDTRKWDRPIPMGCYPPPKACASMVYYKQSFILFGGWAHAPPLYPLFQVRKFFNELHIYSITNNKWTAIETLLNPPCLCAHSATVHDNIMVVFGGMSDFLTSSNDIWCFNLDTHDWYSQPTSQPRPQARYGHSQIPLDDNNLLIVGGCTGPNVGIGDVWLLSMTGKIWTWTKVKLNGNEWAPSMIWCHKACKVGDNVIVLGKKKLKNQVKELTSNDKATSHGRVSLASDNAKLPDVRSNEHENEQRNLPSVSTDRDENVNGNRGRLVAPQNVQMNLDDRARQIQIAVNLSARLHNWHGPMAAFNPRQGLNRLRLIDLPRKLRDDKRRITEERRLQNERKKRLNRLSIYVLNISNVLCDDNVATWLEHNKTIRGPEERILYSFVLGKGELIFFGGTKKFSPTRDGVETDSSEVFNDVHFLNPPPYTI